MYYYIYQNQSIIEQEFPIDTDVFFNFTPMSQEQIDYYLSKPGCTYFDLLSMNHNNDIPVVADLSSYKIAAIDRISKMSLMRMEKLNPTYQTLNTILSCINKHIFNSVSIYDDYQYRISKIMDCSASLRDEFYRMKFLIENAENDEEIETIIAGNKYEEIS